METVSASSTAGISEGTEKSSGWTATFVLLSLTFAGLFVLCPYATGYGDERKPIAYWLWYFWRFPEWQHCVLVPVISAWLIWRMRGDLSACPVRGTHVGIPVIGLAMLLFFAGHRANIYYLGYASCQLLIAGVILWMGGWPWFRKLAFVWCFLLFMWPLYFLESRIGFPLRMLMTDLCSALLGFFGIEHLQLGTSLVSPSNEAAGLVQGEKFALEVANPCSGIRSLFALMMVGAVYGYVKLKHTWQWMSLWLAAVPLAIAGNVVRILVLLFGTWLFGAEFAIGPEGGTSTFHFFAGVAVFVTAIGGMVLVSSALRWIDRRFDGSAGNQ